MPVYRVGVDVGGTFTDLVAFDQESGELLTLKIPSTPATPEEAVLAALTTLHAPLQIVNHSSTIATNALLGQAGLELRRIALLTTAGFRDVLEIGRQNRSEVYNLFVQRPRPLVARADRYGVSERIDANGQIVTPLDESQLRQIAQRLLEEGIRDVAVCYLHSYLNPGHEQRTGEILQAEIPDLTVTLSSVIDPEYREYERTSTTAIAALLRPLVQGYLQRLYQAMQTAAISAPLYVMQSNGGMAGAITAGERPQSLIESGPAAGVVAAAALGRTLGIQKLLSFDMGGTTAKAGVVFDGIPAIASEFEAAGRTHSGRAVRGSGYPVRYPFIDLAEVSAGGGTIAHVDEAGILRVGPLSAGAEPGPACYGHGGADATVTDANLLLGRLPAKLMSGLILQPQLAIEAVDRLAAALPGMDRYAVALGIIRIIEAEMAKVLRIVTVERGYDPRDFTLIAFGGAGPLHACALAGELAIPRIIVPSMPGLFSAWGLLVAPPSAGGTRAILERADRINPAQIESIFRHIEREAAETLERMGSTSTHAERRLEMRYLGQSWELNIPVVTPFDAAALARAQENFHTRHRQVYGYAIQHEPVEIVAARSDLQGDTPIPALPERALHEKPAIEPAQTGITTIYFDAHPDGPDGIETDLGTTSMVYRVETPVYDRSLLQPGSNLPGPALIEQYDSVTLILPGWQGTIDSGGNLVLTHGQNLTQTHISGNIL